MADPHLIFRDLIAGRTTSHEAAVALLALGGASKGLVTGVSVLSQSEHAALAALMPAVRWEMLKLNAPGRVPAVDYNSPEYHAYMATAVTIDADPPS